jgi:hypothetical protein
LVGNSGGPEVLERESLIAGPLKTSRPLEKIPLEVESLAEETRATEKKNRGD